jgi:DNA-binding TFAR19-related protein (PDSD5 family)
MDIITSVAAFPFDALPPADPTDVSYLLSRPPAFGKRDGDSNAYPTVMDRLTAIIGSEIRQSELIKLRKQLFLSILGPPNRAEKRLKQANVDAFEAHRSQILETLNTPSAIATVTKIAMEHRSRAFEREMVLMHALRVH